MYPCDRPCFYPIRIGASSIPVAQLAAHMHSGRALHPLHDRHSRHILHWAGEISGAVRAECPAQLEQAFALGAWALELLPTGRADLEIRLDARVAVVAGLTLGHLGQQRFFLQLALVNLRQGLSWAQDHVDEETPDEEDGDEQGRQYLRQEVLRARANIAKRPHNQANPEDDSKCDQEADNYAQHLI